MVFNNKLNKYFESLIIFFTLIIILIHQSDTSIKTRSHFFDQYSQNYFYFVLLYILFSILYFLKENKNFLRIILIIIMNIFIFKSFKNTQSNYYLANQDIVESALLVFVFLFSLNVVISNFNLIKKLNLIVIGKEFLNLKIKSIIKYFSIFLITIFIIEILLYIFLPKNFTNVIPNKNFGNFFFNYPYRHQVLPFIEMGMAGNVNSTYFHTTLSGKNYKIKYTTNNNGFRVPFDFSISDEYEKQDNEIVIVILGGSTALGVGSSDNFTISKLLEKKLNDKIPEYKFTILNLGIGAANTYQEFLALDLYGKIFNPDWVISLTGRNDGHNSLRSNIGAGNPNGHLNRKKLIDSHFYNQPTPKKFFSNTSNLLSKYSILYRISTGSLSVNTIIIDNIYFEETFKTLNFYLKSISNIINSNKTIKYIISNQPYVDLIIDKSGKNFFNRKNILKFEKQNRKRSYPDINKSHWMEYWNSKIGYETKEFLKNKDNVFYTNFNEEFKKIENINDLFIDSTHLTKEGNAIVADRYFEIIIKNIK